ncbi:MAG: metal-dependent hydrolase [Candidatus Acidiferrales bacterium]
MDPLTHTLTALTLSRAATPRLAAPSTLALLVAANVSDVDYLYAVGGAAAFYEHHHGWTHSIAGTVLLAAATALAVRWLARKKKPEAALSLRPLLAAAGLGAASHLLLDWTTPAGARLLWPFRSAQFRLDWFSADLWLLVVLLLGLALPALMRLIAEEIGARRDDRGRLRAARVTLAACVLLTGARATLHSEALTQLDSRLFQGRTPLRSAALPTPLNPFRWEGVVETSATYELAEVRLAPPPAGPAGPERASGSFTTIYKPSESPALDAALATRTARAYLSRARFPKVEILPAAGEGWEVRIHDLAGARPFQARIELDRELKIVSETLFYSRANGGAER